MNAKNFKKFEEVFRSNAGLCEKEGSKVYSFTSKPVYVFVPVIVLCFWDGSQHVRMFNAHTQPDSALEELRKEIETVEAEKYKEYNQHTGEGYIYDISVRKLIF